MLLTKEKIETIFKKLINKEISREEANRWAFNILQECDNFNVTVLPKSLENKIHADGLMYLLAVDLQESKGVYDNDLEDIKNFYEEKWLNSHEEDTQIETVPMDVAIEIDDNWVQCSNKLCEEVFSVRDEEKYIECPKCFIIQLNPLYKSIEA